MSLIKCHECGKEISSEAKACPHCGVAPKKGVGLFGVLILIIFGMYIYNLSTTPTTPSAPQRTQTQIDADAAQSAKKEAAFQRVVFFMKRVRSTLRNPKSIEWDEIRANDDASVICLEYRAQNGFGGMNKEFFVFTKDKASQEPAVWNRVCTKPLQNMKYAVHAM